MCPDTPKGFSVDSMLKARHCVNGNNLTDGWGSVVFEFVGY